MYSTADWEGFSITGLKIQSNDDAGIFASTKAGSEIKNLKLSDFSVSGKNAGALVGSLTQTSISNIQVVNNIASSRIVSATENGGGLIGKANHATKISNVTVINNISSPTADSVVYASSNAGGLIGNADQIDEISNITIENKITSGTLPTNFSVLSALQNGGGLIGNTNQANLSEVSVVNTIANQSPSTMFSIVSASQNGGGVIGNAGKATLTNVIARNDYKDSYTLNPTQYDIKAVSEHAGGLIGNVGNGSQINYCAAALTVSGGTSAGGLIGNASGATIRGCYAAGHTEQGEYYTHETSDSGNGTRDEAVYNVKGSTAGGLVGILSSGSIDKSYSTCSVEGSTAGGFVGSADGSITTCYCTGLVSGTGNNAFIGDGTPSGLSGNYYYSVINEIASSETSTGENTGSAETTSISTVSYKKPMESETTGVVALDETVESYKAFIKIGGIESTPAEPYDSALKGRSYGLKGIKQLDASAKGDIINHYGDWPTPEAKEISVVNFVNTK